MKTTLLRIFALVLFSIGALSGIVFFAAATFADVEAVFYGFDRYGYKATSRFYCPVVIADDEKGEILFVLENNTETEIRPTVRFQSSSPLLFRTEVERLVIAPGERQTLTWTIDRRHLAYNNLIFAKVMTYASYPAPDVEQTCGVLVFYLFGLDGRQATILVFAVSLLGMWAGVYFWLRSQPVTGRAREAWPAMLTLAAVVLAGLVSVLLGAWPLGILLTAFSLVMIGVIVGHFVQNHTA